MGLVGLRCPGRHTMIHANGLCYQCPSEKYVAGLASQVPDDSRFTFQVTDDSTPSGAK